MISHDLLSYDYPYNQQYLKTTTDVSIQILAYEKGRDYQLSELPAAGEKGGKLNNNN